jgi:hypothetical protein
LPGFSDCISGAVSTCEYRQVLEITGNYAIGPFTTSLTNVSVAAIPEPGTAMLLGLAGAVLILSRRRR